MVTPGPASIVVVEFPFSDLSGSKLRPAVVLCGLLAPEDVDINAMDRPRCLLPTMTGVWVCWHFVLPGGEIK